MTTRLGINGSCRIGRLVVGRIVQAPARCDDECGYAFGMAEPVAPIADGI